MAKINWQLSARGSFELDDDLLAEMDDAERDQYISECVDEEVRINSGSASWTITNAPAFNAIPEKE